MDRKRISARDRRMAAVHEAGHVVIAGRLGLYPSSVWIVPNDDWRPDERMWIGRAQFLAGLARLGLLERRMIGCAGAVAELCWRGEFVDAHYWTDPEMMSLSDWRLAGCEPGEADQQCIEAIEEVGQIFAGPAWDQLIAESRRLIVASR